MKILAFDAALGPFSVALDIDGVVTAVRSDQNDALEAGLVRINALLASAAVGLHQLDRIGVGIGPGSFTGIRIALSFAKALAYAAHLPLIGISSYDILTPVDAALPALTVVAGRPGVLCVRLLTAHGRTLACGATADVFERLLARCAPGTDLTLIAGTEDVFPPIGERHVTVHRMISPAAANPAVVIAGLARAAALPPDLALHALAPDYGELPAVSLPKARPAARLGGGIESRH